MPQRLSCCIDHTAATALCDWLNYNAHNVPMFLQALARAPRPPRPGYCNAGDTVTIKVNHVQVKCNLQQAFHYDVVLNRPRKSKLLALVRCCILCIHSAMFCFGGMIVAVAWTRIAAVNASVQVVCKLVYSNSNGCNCTFV